MRIKYDIKTTYNYNIIEYIWHLKNNKKNNEYLCWYSDGHLFVQGNYIDNKRNGECKDWYENGQLLIFCYYKDDKLDGEYKEWYASSNIRLHRIYKDGKIIKIIKDMR